MVDYARIDRNNAVPSLHKLHIWAVEDLQQEDDSWQKFVLVELAHLEARVDAILYHLEVIWMMNCHLIEANRAKNREVPLSGPGVLIDARYEVDATFFELARLQDRLTEFPRNVLRYGSEPATMRKIVARMLDGTKLMPLFKATKDSFLDYWASSGKTLRDYRNHSAHHHPQFEESYFNRISNRIHIPVPDNPEARKWSDFVFDESRDGAELSFRYAHELFDLCEKTLQVFAQMEIPKSSNAWSGRMVFSQHFFSGGGLRIPVGSEKPKED